MRFKVVAVAGISALTAMFFVMPGSALADSFRDDQWYLKTLQITQVHELSQGSGVTVGVVDTGVYPHPDLERNLLKGVDLASGGFGDGREDVTGHGTNMAALIAAHGKSADHGVLGIAPLAKILPVRISKSADAIPHGNLENGIIYAVNHGAKVVNVSVVGGPSVQLQDAISAAESTDVVVVAGSGNEPKQSIIGYPAAMAGVLSVGASNKSQRHAGFSVSGPQIQICAPGVDITTAGPKNRYFDVDGTSPATAIVSGAAALVRAKFPQLAAPDVIHRLTATADDIGPPGRDDECGFGELNIVKALTADVPPLSTGTPGPTASASSTSGTPETAAPSPGQSAGSSTAAVVGWVLGILAVVGLVGFLVVRRRSSS